MNLVDSKQIKARSISSQLLAWKLGVTPAININSTTSNEEEHTHTDTDTDTYPEALNKKEPLVINKYTKVYRYQITVMGSGSGLRRVLLSAVLELFL